MDTKPRIKVKAESRPVLTVVPFTPWEGVPNPKIVGMLEDMLERARSGTIQAIAFATVNESRGTTTGYAGGYTTTLQGALVELQHRLVTSGD